MATIGNSFTLNTGANIINCVRQQVLTFDKNIAYAPTVSINDEGYLNVRQEYVQIDVPYTWDIEVILTVSEALALITDWNAQLLSTKAVETGVSLPNLNEVITWTLGDSMVAGVDSARGENMFSSLIFNSYTVVPTSLSYQERGNTHLDVSINLLEVKS